MTTSVAFVAVVVIALTRPIAFVAVVFVASTRPIAFVAVVVVAEVLGRGVHKIISGKPSVPSFSLVLD